MADDRWQTGAPSAEAAFLAGFIALRRLDRPAESVAQLRIVQRAHGGSDRRPDLMWVEQIELVR